MVYAVAQAYAKLFQPKIIALGKDVRRSGPSLWSAAARGFTDHGVDVVDIGTICTDMLYFAVGAYGYDGGITISASHNPVEFNGMKMIRKGVIPISGDSGIYEIRDIVRSEYAYKAPVAGKISRREIRAEYLERCLSFVDRDSIRPMRVVVNGMFGVVIKNVEGLNLPLDLVKLNAEPDGSFPKGPPDPLLPENRVETVALVKSAHVDMGVAWDGDADRVFFFDEQGQFIPGYYVTAFLAAHFGKENKGAGIVYDPRLIWAVEEQISQGRSIGYINKAGHSFIKERMRKENAIFGGEMSGHYYFRDFYYADNGLIPFLLMLEIVSKSGKKVSELFEFYFKKYFVSEEINFPLESVAAAGPVLEKIKYAYPDASFVEIDGLSVEYSKWRANIRPSNNQPLIRINVEARTSEILEQKIAELVKIVRGEGMDSGL